MQRLVILKTPFILVGSLKGTDLYRFVIEDDQLQHRELLFTGMGRIRDIEVGPGGLLYLLLEHDAGSKIVQLRPIDFMLAEIGAEDE